MALSRFGDITAIGALIVGLLAGMIVSWAVTWKTKWGIDETLDAFAVHGVGGIAGTICVVLIGSSAAPAGITGVLFGGEPSIIWRELVAVAATCLYSFGMTALIAWALKKTIGIRVDEQTEQIGLDEALHAETAYAD
jgi:Amt family ammonium transporter